MPNRVTTSSESQIRQSVLNEIVEAFETVWDRDGRADVEDFFPAADHPDFEAIATELLCVDLERRWHRGNAKTVETYLQQFPSVLASQHAIQQLAFEEYRLRNHLGEPVTPAEYARRFRLSTEHWPQSSPAEFGYDQADPRRETSMSVAGEAERLTSAIQNLPDVGGQFLDFEIVEQLGGSKYGRVYLARQHDLANRLVVIKITTGQWAESERLARLQHTNVVPIYSVHQRDGMQVVCMPFLGRHTLCDVLRKLGERSEASSSDVVEFFAGPENGTASPKQAKADCPNPLLDYLRCLTVEQLFVWIVSRIASGLAHAHERGILHRDLKPANILLTEEGQPMILDFNLSADVVAGGRASLMVGGTLPYMAPEHLKAVVIGGPVDAPSDIYSLGVILFQMLTGRLPFEVHSGPIDVASAVMIDERSSTTPSARGLRAHLSPAVDSVVRKCLAPDASQRYQSARQLQEDLERHLRDYPLKYAPDRSIAERTRKWFRRNPQVRSAGTLGIIAAVVLATVITLLAWRGQEVARLEAIDVYQDFESRTGAARIPLSVRTTNQQTLQEGITAAKGALGLYRLDEPNWQEYRTYRLLDDTQKARFRQAAAELLFLLAGSRYRRANGIDDPAARERELLEALRDSEASQSIGGSADVPPALVLQQAEIASALEFEDEAARLYRRAAKLRAGNRIDRYYTAVRQIGQRQYAKALPLLERLQEEMPHDFLVWFLSGTSYFGLRQFSDAESCFTTCITLWPRSHYPYFNRGICRLKLRRFHDAERDFSEVLGLHPDQSVALVNRALARIKLGLFYDAVDDLTAAIKGGRDDSLSYLLRSQAWQAVGDQEKAREDREKGLHREPVSVDGWVRRGMARLPDDPEGALADLEVALKLSPHSRRALQNKAHILAEFASRPEEAVTTLNRLLELNPRHAAALAGRGVLHARQGRRQAALKDGRDALALDRSSQTTYQAACILAQTSKIIEHDAIEAVKLLGESFGQELRWATQAAADVDLAPLAKRSDFSELLAAALKLHQTKSTFGNGD